MNVGGVNLPQMRWRFAPDTIPLSCGLMLSWRVVIQSDAFLSSIFFATFVYRAGFIEKTL
jgi:hypothetical protein